MKPASLPNIRIIYRGNPQSEEHFKSPKLNQKTYQTMGQSQESKCNKESFDFSNKLDSRDEIIRIPLQIKKGDAVFNEEYKGVILNWLANMVQNILSVTFKHILIQNLTVLEGKAYASKNILLNIKQTCEQIHRVFKKDIDTHFMEFLDNSLFQIISQLSNKYPQQNTKGASKKVKDFIKKISNRQNDQYDFIYKNNITIKYNPSGDYSQDIMKIINKIINIPQENPTNCTQNNQQVKTDELFHEFQGFCTNLFYQSTKKTQQNLTYSTTKQIPFAEIWGDKKTSEDGGGLQIRNTLEGNKRTIKAGHGKTENDAQAVKIEVDELEVKKLIDSYYQMSEQFLKFQQKKNSSYSILQKIPSQVKTFNEKQIRSGKFRAYHASISRVITKWAECLYQKLEQANEKIRHRLFKFKTNEKKINSNEYEPGETKLRYCEVQEKQFLYQAAINQKLKVDKYFQNLKKDNKNLQAILSVQSLEGMYLKKYTNVSIFAGRIQQILNQLTFKYLNRLIHSLLTVTLEASQSISQHYRIYENDKAKANLKKQDLSKINLINFNVGDLLRARYICLEHQFINTLAYLYKIQQTNPLFLKIVKIKNRLDDNNNDILINFFFKNTIMCELQLAIFKDTNKKEHLYTQFNHFLYQLKRSSFGVISALSNVIAQHDPVVNQFTFNKLKHPKLLHSPPPSKEKNRIPDKLELRTGQKIVQTYLISHNLIQKSIEIPFICSSCKSLKIVHNTKFYQRNVDLQSVCNQCIQKRLKQSPSKQKQIIQNLFKFYILDQKMSQFVNLINLWNPSQELKGIKDETQLYTRFIKFGFIIEKGQKLPKVRFFKKFYNPIKNSLILSTVISGNVKNFLRLDCKKHSGSFEFISQLDKFLIFSLPVSNESSLLKQIQQNFISEENEQADFRSVLDLKPLQILKIEYIGEIESSFQKYYSTLYLNGYKFVLDYLQDYAEFQGESSKFENISIFKKKALYVTNLELQSCQISLLKPVVCEFANLKELNLSNNSIKELTILKNLAILQTINVSRNRITSIQPLCQLIELRVVIAADNVISNLKNTNKIEKLVKLDCSRNIIQSLQGIQGLIHLKSLELNYNFITSIDGVDTLKKLQKLILSHNSLQKVQHIDFLLNLTEVDLSFNNQISQFPSFEVNYNLAILRLGNNSIKALEKLVCSKLKYLCLSQNQITKIQHLEYLSELQSLDLSVNQIEKLQNLEGLVKLKELIMNNNQIKIIENLQNLKMLEKVVLAHNPIISIANLNHLKYLNNLNIEYCKIEQIKQLDKLKRMKNLDLSNNQIQKIFQIDELVRIESLDLGQNKIAKIQNLQYLKYLQSLSLMGNRISQIENLGELTELQWIILSNNQISKLQNLDNLYHLHILELQNNHIERLQNLQGLEQLSQLWLTSNNITTIANLNKLAKLKRLGLAHNSISKIQGLQNLVSLQILDLQANYISKIQNLDSLHELKWLVISVNSINKIEGLSNLWQLQTLFLEHNHIEAIQNLDKLTRLTYLKLQFNHITQIQGLSHLQNLEKLYLQGNYLQKIENLQGLHNLNELILKGNRISKMQNLNHLSKLQFLDVSYNQIEKQQNIQQLNCLKRLEIQKNLISALQQGDFMDIMAKVKLMTDSNQLNKIPDDIKYKIKYHVEGLLRRFEPSSLKKEQSYQQKVEFNKQESLERNSQINQSILSNIEAKSIIVVKQQEQEKEGLGLKPFQIAKRLFQSEEVEGLIQTVQPKPMNSDLLPQQYVRERQTADIKANDLKQSKKFLIHNFTKRINNQI